MEDETVKEILADLEAAYVKDWKQATTPELRERQWFRVQTLEDLKKELRRLRDSGNLAAK